MTAALLRRLRASSFDTLHLPRNPFGELTRDERARAARVDVAPYAAHLSAPGRAVQFLADHGRGKSTHLIALHARHFPTSVYTQLHVGSPAPVAAGDVECVDSVENLRRRARLRMFREAKSLACTTHRDLSRELRRAGFEVLTVRIGIRSIHELAEIIEARIAGQELRPGAAPRPSHERLEVLFTRHGSDVRSIEQALYADYEALRLTTSPDDHATLRPEN